MKTTEKDEECNCMNCRLDRIEKMLAQIEGAVNSNLAGSTGKLQISR